MKGRRLTLQPSSGLTTRFQFGDGWEPEEADKQMQAPNRLVRRVEPRDFDRASGCGVRLIEYDVDGRVVGRVALPAGYELGAFGGTTDDVLAASETDVVFCSAEATEQPAEVLWLDAAKGARAAPREPPAEPPGPARPDGVAPIDSPPVPTGPAIGV
ncbi:MAG: hypothetical protein HY907_19065 [Deltaproteobacteria bacterium]|nr:hypothetical protein [Deltaproteobacteria bacterium]